MLRPDKIFSLTLQKTDVYRDAFVRPFSSVLDRYLLSHYAISEWALTPFRYSYCLPVSDSISSI